MASPNALIAVVDDEPPVRTMLLRALRLDDYDVASYASGDEFLADLPSAPPACVVIDIRMPGLSGLEVARRMRSMGQPIPVILITASDDAGLVDEATSVGAACLLRKPFSTNVLLIAVRDAIAHTACRH